MIFKISSGFLVAALALLALSLYLSDRYIDEQRQLAAAGDLRGAMEASKVAARLDPFDTDPLEARSSLLQQQGRNEEAAEALKEAIRRDPNNYLPYLFLGNLQLSMGKFDKAIETYRKVLELNPRASVASNGLAQALIRKGQLKEARKIYEKLENENEMTYQGLYDLGRIYVRTGEPMKGFRTIKRAQNRAAADLDTLEGPFKSQRQEIIQSMDLALADALVVHGSYARAREIIAESESEQAPALLQLLDMDPEGYRRSVLDSEIY